MSRALLRAALLTTLVGGGVGGCATVGTHSIEEGRTPYNEVIQSTSEQQTLLNLVRVHDGETPLFVDVTEVDAQTSAQASIMGNPTMIGTAGTAGSITVSGQYQEQPTVRYQPLLGAALVAQVSSPVTAESLVNLYNSGWPLGSVFDLAVTRLTPSFDDYHVAVDALMTLDRYGALVLEAKAPDKSKRLSKGNVTVMTGEAPKGDAALVIYFRHDGLRTRFLPCDQGKKSGDDDDTSGREEQLVKSVADKLWARVEHAIGQHGRRLVLTLKSGADLREHIRDDAPPGLQTRSALGVLKNAAEGDNLVVFDAKEDVDRIIAATRAADGLTAVGDLTAKCHASFYRAGDRVDGEDNVFGNRMFTMMFDGTDKGVLSDVDAKKEVKFGDSRRLILIQITTERPVDGFAAVRHGERWYSIRADDIISKRNLALVTQIDTIQAVAPQTQPLTPAIVVGGR